VLDELGAFRFTEDDLLIRGEGTDPDGDVESLVVTLLDDDDDPVEYEGDEDIVFPLLEVSGESEFEAIVALTGMSDYPEVVSVRCVLEDRAGLRSESITVPIDDFPRVGIGEPCEPEGIMGLCVVGASCDPETERCVAESEPTIESLEIFRVGPGIYRAVIEGADDEGTVVEALATFVDADGDDVPWESGIAEIGDLTDIPMPFTWSVMGDEDFTVGVEMLFTEPDGEGDSTPDGATGFRIELIDRAENLSDSVIAYWTDLPVRGDGTDCDPLGLSDVCGDDRICSSTTSECMSIEDAEEARCDGVVTELRSGISARLDLIGLYSVSTGRCGGEGPDAIYRLVVAEPSSVVITTDRPDSSESSDTVLYVRETCDLPMSEVDCDDNSGTGLLAELAFDELEAGTYYVVVDSEFTRADVEVRATVTPL